jgi:hypothetical protein
MRNSALLSLLLLGSLQAAIAPAVFHDEPGGLLQFRDSPYECLPATAENPTEFKRLADTSRQSALQGDGKLSKIVLAGAPIPVPVGDPASSRTAIAGPSDADSIQLNPGKPRAPPSAPPF